MQPLIEIKNVSKIFGSTPKKMLAALKKGFDKDKVLKQNGHTVGVYQANMAIKQGEIFVIMGLSGSGKSTLLRCLNLLHKPTGGEILYKGENILKYDKKQLLSYRRDKVSMVFQNFGLLTHRNVIDNVAYGLEIKGMSRSERHEKAKHYIEMVGLEGYEYKAISDLSGGMKQRVGLARALATDAEILLMDEPFSALDPIVRREMQFELLKIQKELKKTIIFITHDMNEACKVGDRIAIMKDSMVVQQGTPEHILEHPADRFVEEFIMDIDKSKVLTAAHIMTTPSALVTKHAGAKQALKEMQSNGLSSAYWVDDDMKLLGVITLDGAMTAYEQKKPIEQYMITNVETITKDTSVHDILPLASQAHYPIPVLDSKQRFVGIITRGQVLGALAESQATPSKTIVAS